MKCSLVRGWSIVGALIETMWGLMWAFLQALCEMNVQEMEQTADKWAESNKLVWRIIHWNSFRFYWSLAIFAVSAFAAVSAKQMENGISAPWVESRASQRHSNSTSFAIECQTSRKHVDSLQFMDFYFGCLLSTDQPTFRRSESEHLFQFDCTSTCELERTRVETKSHPENSSIFRLAAFNWTRWLSRTKHDLWLLTRREWMELLPLLGLHSLRAYHESHVNI